MREAIKSAVLDFNMEIPWKQEWSHKHSFEDIEDDPLVGSNIREAARIIREWWTAPHGAGR